MRPRLVDSAIADMKTIGGPVSDQHYEQQLD